MCMYTYNGCAAASQPSNYSRYYVFRKRTRARTKRLEAHGGSYLWVACMHARAKRLCARTPCRKLRSAVWWEYACCSLHLTRRTYVDDGTYIERILWLAENSYCKLCLANRNAIKVHHNTVVIFFSSILARSSSYNNEPPTTIPIYTRVHVLDARSSAAAHTTLPRAMPSNAHISIIRRLSVLWFLNIDAVLLCVCLALSLSFCLSLCLSSCVFYAEDNIAAHIYWVQCCVVRVNAVVLHCV